MVENKSTIQMTPVLDEYWICERLFLKYEAPILVDSQGKYITGAKERWLELVRYICEDVTWLLLQPSCRFWSCVIYNSSIIDSIVIFLQEAPTPYTLKNFPDDNDIKEHFDKLRKSILLVLARFMSNQETALNYIDSVKHAYLLYNKYILTVPILMDICQQYGQDNRKIIEKIVNEAFTIQPLYEKDLEKVVEFVVKVLQNVERKFEDYSINQIGKTELLLKRGRNTKESSLSDLEDIILYTTDIVSTVSSFIDIYSPAATVFNKENFLLRITSVYSNTIPAIYARLDTLAFRDEVIEKYLELKHFLDIMRFWILNIYRKIIYKSIHDVSENKKVVSSTKMECIVEDFLTNLMSSLSGKEFIIDYNNLYPVIDDFQVLAKLYPDLDPLKCEFIMKSVFVFFDEPMSFTNSQVATTTLDFLRKLKRASTKDNLSESSNEITATRLPCNNTDPKTNLIQLIKEVKDIFSDLTEGFIEKCLENYNYSSESVINAVLENSLPTELISFYCMSPVIPPLSDEASAAIDVDIGRQRLNIYNNNEFDVITQSSVKSSNIQQGQRKDKHKSLNELLNDKSYLVATKYIYNRYSIVSDDYDDEYDDTYDDINTIGLNTQDDIADINGRPFTTPNVFRKYKSNNSEKIEKIEFEDAVNIKENRSLFPHNPDLKKTKTKERPCHNSKARTVDPQNELVIGNLIDQGQPKNFSDCGKKKNIKKSSRPNHNRRSASQWKRNQGALPL